jgi:acyl-CoA-binding protein
MATMLSWDQSGGGAAIAGHITLDGVHKLALDAGFVKSGTDAGKPDIAAFWKATGVNSLSAFKAVFAASRMAPPKPGTVAPRIIPGAKKVVTTQAAASEASAPPANVVVPDVADFEKLCGTWEQLKWRIIPRPGGATMKPADWYTIYAAMKQANVGDCAGDKPMWAETGGLDFDAREAWEAWDKLRGVSSAAAKQLFCEAFGRAMSREAENFRKY